MDIEKRFLFVKEVGDGGRMGLEFGISRCKLLYTEWIDNKILLCSTGTVFNILWQTIIGKNKKMTVYTHTSLCYTA